MLVAKILENPHPAEALLELDQDHLAKRLASIGRPRADPGIGFGRF